MSDLSDAHWLAGARDIAARLRGIGASLTADALYGAPTTERAVTVRIGDGHLIAVAPATGITISVPCAEGNFTEAFARAVCALLPADASGIPGTVGAATAADAAYVVRFRPRDGGVSVIVERGDACRATEPVPAERAVGIACVLFEGQVWETMVPLSALGDAERNAVMPLDHVAQMLRMPPRLLGASLRARLLPWRHVKGTWLLHREIAEHLFYALDTASCDFRREVLNVVTEGVTVAEREVIGALAPERFRAALASDVITMAGEVHLARRREVLIRSIRRSLAGHLPDWAAARVSEAAEPDVSAWIVALSHGAVEGQIWALFRGDLATDALAEGETLTTREAAEHLGLDRATVAALCDSGALAGGLMTPGGGRRVPAGEVVKWLLRSGDDG